MLKAFFFYVLQTLAGTGSIAASTHEIGDFVKRKGLRKSLNQKEITKRLIFLKTTDFL